MDTKTDRLESLRRVAARLQTMQDDDFARAMLARLQAEIARHDREAGNDKRSEPVSSTPD